MKFLLLVVLFFIPLHSNANDSIMFFSYDNDSLVSYDDKDFNYGISLNIVGEKANIPIFEKPRSFFDNVLFDTGDKDYENGTRSIGFGVQAFTQDYDGRYMYPTERPFSSLVFVSSTNSWDVSPGTSYSTTLTLGALGLSVADKIQSEWHRLHDEYQYKNWDTQISHGGEPTFRYSIRKHDLLFKGEKVEFVLSNELMIGYITEVNSGVSFRYNAKSLWSSFSPTTRLYGEQTALFQKTNNKKESFLWASLQGRLRLYNSLLSGQFRETDFTVVSDDIDMGILNFSLGYSHTFGAKNNFVFNVYANIQSSETKRGYSDRDLTWAGFSIGRKY